MPKNKAQAENPNSNSELQRTQPPKTPLPDLVWEQDVFRHIGYKYADMTRAMAKLDPTIKDSFKQAVLAFSTNGDYGTKSLFSFVTAISTSLKTFPVDTFDTEWIAKSLEVPSVVSNFNIIKRFFIFWKSRDPQAISSEALQLLAKTQVKRNECKNVLSDNPEKSWLSDEEYEALLTSIWHNYEDGIFSTDRTLILLLSMQYARRPVQLSQLKIQDFRIAAPGDASGIIGPMISFPGAKDLSAETEFRGSKFEYHPLPEHLWKLFEIQRHETRSLFKFELGIILSDSEIEKLPIFATAGSIKRAVSKLTDYYQVDYRTRLSSQLFHMPPDSFSKTLAWKRLGGREDIKPPISHRTGQPIVVSATRLRHTRARQLARKGVPLHVLSHWMGHTHEQSLRSYYNDPAEDARKLDEAMAPALIPLAMAFAGNLIDSEDQASRYDDPTSRLEHASGTELKNVGNCGKHSFCATTSIPIPCYRCRHFEPLVTAPHEEVLEALKLRQEQENEALHIGGARDLLIPIDLSADIFAVQNCIDRCNARKIELGIE